MKTPYDFLKKHFLITIVKRKHLPATFLLSSQTIFTIFATIDSHFFEVALFQKMILVVIVSWYFLTTFSSFICNYSPFDHVEVFFSFPHLISHKLFITIFLTIDSHFFEVALFQKLYWLS